MILADYMVEMISRLGIRHVFGVGGANIEDVLDSLHRRSSEIRMILAKHEYSAGNMAAGYSQTSDKLGIVLTTSGGGAMYLLPAIAEAYASRIPMLAIIGQPPADIEGHGAFQDSSGLAGSIDAEELFSAVSLFCRRIESPYNFQKYFAQAIELAMGTKPGPAVLLIPKDVQLAEVDAKNMHHLVPPVLSHDTLDEDSLRLGEIWEVLSSVAKTGRGRIVIIAGEGIARHKARSELAILAEKLDALVVVTPDAKDVFNNYNPRFAGVTGAMGHSNVTEAVKNADLVVIIGTRMPQMSFMGLEKILMVKPIISLNFERSFLNRSFIRFDLLEVIANIRESISALLMHAGINLEEIETLAKGQTFKEQITDDGDPEPQGKSISILDALERLKKSITEDANLLIDAGNTGASVVHHLKAPSRGRVGLALGMGGMGYSFGAAVGAACGNGKPTWVLAGDGSFFMHGMEIHTAVQHKLPITYVIFNNCAHGMCFTRAKVRHSTDIDYYLFGESRIGAGLAAMFPGLPAVDATTLGEIVNFLEATGDVSGSRVLSIRLDVNEVPPYLPFKH